MGGFLYCLHILNAGKRSFNFTKSVVLFGSNIRKIFMHSSNNKHTKWAKHVCLYHLQTTHHQIGLLNKGRAIKRVGYLSFQLVPLTSGILLYDIRSDF